MKKNIKVLGLLPFILAAPALMAVKGEIESNHNYDIGYTVTVKAIEDETLPNLYEFTINNNGDFYLEKNYLYSKIDSIGIRYSFSSLYFEYRNLFKNELIKPKEICVIQAQIDPSKKLTEGEFDESDYRISAYYPRRDLFTVSGPYTCSFENLTNYSRLEIDCNIKRNENIKIEGDRFFYYYAISLTYDGITSCISNFNCHYDELLKPYVYFDYGFELDNTKFEISEIDCFIEVYHEYPMDCDGHGESLIKSIFKIVLIVFSIIGIFALIFGLCCFLNTGNRKLKDDDDRINNADFFK